MNGIMEGIESRHGNPFTFNKDLILNNEFLDLPCLQFNLTPDTVFMGKIPKICFHNDMVLRSLISLQVWSYDLSGWNSPEVTSFWRGELRTRGLYSPSGAIGISGILPFLFISLYLSSIIRITGEGSPGFWPMNSKRLTSKWSQEGMDEARGRMKNPFCHLWLKNEVRKVKSFELCLPAGASAQAGALNFQLVTLILKGSYGRPRRILTILSEALPSQSWGILPFSEPQNNHTLPPITKVLDDLMHKDYGMV